MEKYYRVSLRNKEGNIIYPNIHDFITFNETTGSMTITNNVGRTCFKADRTDTDTSVWMGVGTSGTNHGVYSEKLANWIVYSDGIKSYLNGTANTAYKWQTARAIGIVNSDGTGTAVTVSVDGSKNINLKLPSEIKANTSSATKLQTARKINGVNFDGTADITVYDSTKLPLAGGTMTGNISYNMYEHTNIPVKVYGGNKDGLGISVGAGGATIIGAGESAKAMESLVPGGTETMYICSDNGIEFYVACQTIGNKVGVGLDVNRNFYPFSNNVGSIGTSSNKWANMYATNFHGYLDGNAFGATKLQKNTTLFCDNHSGISYNDGDGWNTSHSNSGWAAPTSAWYQIIHLDLSVNGYWNQLYVPVNDTQCLWWRQRRSSGYYGFFSIPISPSGGTVRQFRAGTISDWNSNYSNYNAGTVMFCW